MTTSTKKPLLKKTMMTLIFTSQNLRSPHFGKNYGFWAVVAISQNFPRNENYSIKFKKPVMIQLQRGFKIRADPYRM